QEVGKDSIAGDLEAVKASIAGDLEAVKAPIARSEKLSAYNSEEKQNSMEAPGVHFPAGDLQNHLILDISVNMTGVELAVDGRQVYSAYNKTVPWAGITARLHAGLHLITLHQSTGQVMRATSYMTWQTNTDRQFIKDLEEIQDSRLLVILGAPDFTAFMEEETIATLEDMGAHYIDRMAYMDTWCLLVYKGSGVVLEALTTSLPQHNLTKFDVSPLTVRTVVPRMQEHRCGWYTEEGMQERATFCKIYEGYGTFCICDDPPWSPHPHN
ncbi:O-linked-mannose beta-1-2-N-acetylglucosaminyltransferase 1-like 34, partial [Homarus americanus]